MAQDFVQGQVAIMAKHGQAPAPKKVAALIREAERFVKRTAQFSDKIDLR